MTKVAALVLAIAPNVLALVAPPAVSLRGASPTALYKQVAVSNWLENVCQSTAGVCGICCDNASCRFLMTTTNKRSTVVQFVRGLYASLSRALLHVFVAVNRVRVLAESVIATVPYAYVSVFIISCAADSED